MRFDCVLFDLDGTLWDSRETVCVAWNRILEEEGAPVRLTPQSFDRIMGHTDLEIIHMLSEDMPHDLAAKCFYRAQREECPLILERGGKLYPGCGEVLAALSQRAPLAIVSNCGDGYIEAFLTAHKLEEYFSDYEYAGRTGRAKGENIRLVLDRNGWQLPIYVGDTAGDQRAAQQAGIPFLYAAYGFGEAAGARALERLGELPQVLENWRPDFRAETGVPGDLDRWMDCVRAVRGEFPGLETREALADHRRTVQKNLDRGTALCVRDGDLLAAVLLFSPGKNVLSFLAVRPAYRRLGLGTGLIKLMLEKLPGDRDVTVTTFREEDPKGPAARGLYRRAGFEAGELCEEFGAPCQKFILRRSR